MGSYVNRVVFLPVLPHLEYLAMLQMSDVVLDTLHFGGGVTAYECIRSGVPFVTLPLDYLRSRVALGLYKFINVMDCVAKNKMDYVSLAVQIGSDESKQNQIRKKIVENLSPLLDTEAGISNFIQWFHSQKT